jgi:hypothetical protein
MNRRDRPRDEEYSALSTETPRRHRPSRMPGPHSDLSTELTEDTPRGDPTATSLLTPNPNQPAMMAGALGAAGSRPGHQRPLTPPQSRRPGRRHSFDDTEYSSYVSPSRRLPEDTPAKAGGLGKGILAGMGLGWIGKKLADRRSKKDEERRLQEEDDMRSGLSGSRFTGDGFPSPTRRPSRRPPVRRQTGFNPATTQTEMTESSIDSRPPVTSRPTAGGGRSHSRSRSRTHIEPATMPALPGDPGGIFSEGETSLTSKQSAAQRRTSSRRRRDGEMATAAAAARAAELAADESPSRSRYASPHSQPVSMKLRVHDDKDRKVTLRMLSEEEARRERGGSHSRADSESSLSGLESPSYGRGRYRRDSSQRRAEAAAERRAEASGAAGDALEPPNPAFAKTARRSAAQKDSAYYSGGGAGGAAGGTAQAGPSGSTPAAGQTVSSLGSLASPESHGTWSAMSPSPGDKPGQSSAAAADNRRRRRLERRRGSSSRPSGTDMFD